MATSSISPGTTILKAWLIAGTLDITGALIYYSIKVGNNPLNLLSNIAKFVLGKDTSNSNVFTNGFVLATVGLLIHFAIALGWTLIFYWLCPKISLLNKNKIIAGLVYGVFVWMMMTLAVVPLWNMALPHLKVEPAVIGAMILVLAIGIPLSFIIGNYYSKLSSQE